MSNKTLLLKSTAKAALTLVTVIASLMLLATLWRAYVLAPWTRDGRVSAQVVHIAPEVSGPLMDIAVTDNQYVKRGDVLYRIDPQRFNLAIAQVDAQLASATATLRQKTEDAKRRQGMDDLVPGEDIQRANQAVAIAQAEQRYAQVAKDMARLDLERTTQFAPVDGYVTHLRLRQGDYAQAGQPNIALLDAHSFWITGYFEETKLHGIHPGAPALIRLMGFNGLIRGHVASIGRGITDDNEQSNAQGLPSVEPSFSWVRLAQRIPVRIEIDQIPANVVLVAGMTCSIDVGQPGFDSVSQGHLITLLHRWM